MMAKRSRLIVLLLSLFSIGKLKVTEKDRQRLEFKSSTKRMGVSFTDKVRDVFRGRWIKKS